MKSIITSISLSLAASSLVFTLFINSILGFFGLATVSTEALKGLKSSQQIVDKVKQKHEEKKKYAAAEFKKRASKKVLSTAVAAASIGTVAVATTMIGLEVYDYCEAKKDLHENDKILYGHSSEFNFETCIEEGKEDSKVMFTDLMDSSVESVSSAIKSSAEYSAEKWAAIKQVSGEAFETTQGAAVDLWESTRSMILSK